MKDIETGITQEEKEEENSHVTFQHKNRLDWQFVVGDDLKFDCKKNNTRTRFKRQKQTSMCISITQKRNFIHINISNVYGIVTIFNMKI